MRTYAPWLGVVALMTVSASARARMRDALELLPAHTLACVELRQPARLSPEVAVAGGINAIAPAPSEVKKMEKPADKR